MTAVARLLAAARDLPVPEADPDDVRRLADDVLADPAFDSPGPGLVVRARDWLLDQVGDLLRELLSAAGEGPVGWVAVAALTVAAVVLAVRFTRGVQRDPGVALGTPGGPRRPAVDWLADATRLEADGDWRGGVRCRYRALVATLAAAGVLTEVPGRTAGEYRDELDRAAPALAARFGTATDLFEDAWYGHRPVRPVDAERFAALAELVVAGAGAGTRRRAMASTPEPR